MKNKKVAIYARVSSQKQKEGETIDSQLSALRNFASEEGYYVPDEWVFEDNGESGATLQRSGLDGLRDLISVEPLSAVLVYSPDRLSRSYPQQLILLDEFKRQGTKAHFIKSPVEASTPEGVMFQHFQGIFAEYERALILDRSRRGRIYKAKEGNPSIIPSVPYGYRKEKKGDNTTMIIIENEAEIVRSIFKMYVYDELALSEISAHLTEQNIKSPTGLSRWDLSTLRKMLKNTTYTGTSYYGKTESCEGIPDRIRHHKSKVFIKAKYARKMKAEEDWIPIGVPVIISESDFEQAQEQIQKNKILASRNTKTPTLLQGLVICGECGYPYYKRSKTATRSYYHCRSRTRKHLKNCSSRAVRQESLDDLVFKEVFDLLKNPILLEQELERRSKEASNSEEINKKEQLLKKELSKIDNERDRLLDAFQAGVASLDDLSVRNKEIGDRREKIENELKGIQFLRLEAEKDFDIKDSLKLLIKRFDKVSGELPFADKKKLIRLLVDKVVVSADKITIFHCVSPRSIAQETGQLKGSGVVRA